MGRGLTFGDDDDDDDNDAVVKWQNVRNAVTPVLSCGHTSGVRRLSAERLLVLEGCGT